MNALIVLVAIVAAVAAAPQKEAATKGFSFSTGAYPEASQEYFPGQGFQGFQGFQGYNQGFRGVYPAQQQAYYPGYQGYQGYQGFQGYYPGYQVNQGYYPAGYQGYNSVNRGYYPAAPVVPAAYPAATPAPYVAPVVPVAPKFTPIVAPVAPVAPKYTPIAPAVSPVYAKPVDTKTPAIVRQSSEVNYDGNFKYGYETENGIVAQAAGYVKNAGTDNAVQVIEGSYAYVGDDGAPVEVKYYADETGYHAVGNVVPTTPPEIARSLELIASQPQKPEDSKK